MALEFSKRRIDNKEVILISCDPGELQQLMNWCRTNLGKSHGLGSPWRLYHEHDKTYNRTDYLLIRDRETATLLQLMFI